MNLICPALAGFLVCFLIPTDAEGKSHPLTREMYPDGLRALARYAGLEVLEAFTQWQDQPEYDDESNKWHDSVLISRKRRVPPPDL